MIYLIRRLNPNAIRVDLGVMATIVLLYIPQNSLFIGYTECYLISAL